MHAAREIYQVNQQNFLSFFLQETATKRTRRNQSVNKSSLSGLNEKIEPNSSLIQNHDSKMKSIGDLPLEVCLL